VVSSVSPAVPCACHVSSVSTTPCQSSPAVHAPQKKKTRRAGRRIRAARLRTHSPPSSSPADPSVLPPTASTPLASCPLEDSITDIMAILAGVLRLLKKTLVETPKKIEALRLDTRLEIALIWDQFHDLELSTRFAPADLTGDSQHLKPP